MLISLVQEFKKLPNKFQKEDNCQCFNYFGKDLYKKIFYYERQYKYKQKENQRHNVRLKIPKNTHYLDISHYGSGNKKVNIFFINPNYFFLNKYFFNKLVKHYYLINFFLPKFVVYTKKSFSQNHIYLIIHLFLDHYGPFLTEKKNQK